MLRSFVAAAVLRVDVAVVIRGDIAAVDVLRDNVRAAADAAVVAPVGSSSAVVGGGGCPRRVPRWWGSPRYAVMKDAVHSPCAASSDRSSSSNPKLTAHSLQPTVHRQHSPPA